MENLEADFFPFKNFYNKSMISLPKIDLIPLSS
jgi:hypothetical protein